MNRNTESRFAELPGVHIERSMMDLSLSHKTTFNVGDLIPFAWYEVLPGDTFQVTTSVVARLQTLLTPVMDNAYMDTYWFFVEAEDTLDKWKQFMGESPDAWIPETNVHMPLLEAPEGGFQTGTIADYMGIPVGVEYRYEDAPYALPFRGLALVCNEWFRDQNVTDPLNIPKDEADQSGSNGSDYINDVANGGLPFKVAKYHDYFTSALPTPLKASQPVSIDMSASFAGSIPVYGADADNFAAGDTVKGKAMHFLGHTGATPDKYQNLNGVHNVILSGNSLEYQAGSGSATGLLYPSNLIADPTNAAISGLSFTINELRLAYSLQKFYETSARSGTRYRETLLGHFGTHSPDARTHVPEYLGGHRFPLAVHQVVNQSQGEEAFLGDLGAMSNTSDVHDDFVKSFTVHGFVFGVCCVRYDHSYPQGLSKVWHKREITDYYWPSFSAIGEQPIFSKEIMLTGTSADDNVFGYNEAYAEYRYMPPRVSGEFRPGIQNSLASWHFSDYYTQVPTLSDGWIREDKTNVDRTLAVTSALANQVMADFFVKCTATRPMPMFSIPGWNDHH